MKLPNRSFQLESKDVIYPVLPDDNFIVTPPSEIIKERVNRILELLDVGKLENSTAKNVRGKGAYSDKEMTEFLVMLDKNASGSKPGKIATLLRLKKEYLELLFEV